MTLVECPILYLHTIFIVQIRLAQFILFSNLKFRYLMNQMSILSITSLAGCVICRSILSFDTVVDVVSVVDSVLTCFGRAAFGSNGSAATRTSR